LKGDVALLQDWVGRLRKEPPKVVSFTGQVKAVREARQQARQCEKAWRQRSGEANVERAREALMGRERPLPKGFDREYFDFLSHATQDATLHFSSFTSSGWDPREPSRHFNFPYPDPPVPYPTTSRQWPSYGESLAGWG